MSDIRQFLNKEKKAVEAKLVELRERSRTVMPARDLDLVKKSITRLLGQMDVISASLRFLDENP